MEDSLEEHPDEGEGLCGLVKEGGGEWVSKCMNEGRGERGSMVGREIRRRLVKRVRERCLGRERGMEVEAQREDYCSLVLLYCTHRTRRGATSDAPITL